MTIFIFTMSEQLFLKGSINDGDSSIKNKAEVPPTWQVYHSWLYFLSICTPNLQPNLNISHWETHSRRRFNVLDAWKHLKGIPVWASFCTCTKRSVNQRVLIVSSSPSLCPLTVWLQGFLWPMSRRKAGVIPEECLGQTHLHSFRIKCFNPEPNIPCTEREMRDLNTKLDNKMFHNKTHVCLSVCGRWQAKSLLIWHGTSSTL